MSSRDERAKPVQDATVSSTTTTKYEEFFQPLEDRLQQLRSDYLQRGVAPGAPPSREDEVSSTEDCPPSPVPGADPRYDSIRAMQSWLEDMKFIYGCCS
ncbi:hypothetical protein ACOMHN_004269 [Nucella lapillus]